MFHEDILHNHTEQAIGRTELLGAFSYALDLTEGQPAGHSLRACYIASQLAVRLGLTHTSFATVHYAALLKDLGCSSNAARIAELYLSDDRAFKQSWKTIAPGLPATMQFVFGATGKTAPMGKRLSAIGHILTNGDAVAQEMIVSRCTRGADIARDLRLGEGVAEAIYHLDEHWDGGGRPGRLTGEAIPLGSRIALLAQIADVFLQAGGREAALSEVTRRAGTWLDPQLVKVFQALAKDDAFWRALASPLLEAKLSALAPDVQDMVDEDYLDAVTSAFGKVIDAKSPFTAGHSARVADYAEGIATRLDALPMRVRRLRRAAALHDVGKLGVSSAILEKPGKLDDDEWQIMRSHAAHTQAILSRIGVFADMAKIAAAHHEKLDGTGYPLGLEDAQIVRETRIITVCDFYDALTADRPYRAAMPPAKALAIMESEVGKAVDPECFATLKDYLRTAG